MNNKNNNAFTLVELLIVMGIISLLVAIVMPALGRARDQAKLVICKSNQKNLVVGCRMYADDNNSSFPIDKQLHNSHTILINNLSNGSYIDCAEVYYCPSEKEDDLIFSKTNFINGDIGYFYYSFSDRPTLSYLSSFFLFTIKWPRKLKDSSDNQMWLFSDSWFSGTATSHRWYKKGVNYAILDGSVHMVQQSPKSEFK